MPTDLEQIKSIKLAYKKCFETDPGKKVLDDLKRRCFVRRSTFTGDALDTIFNEGTRSMLLHIESMMNMDNINEGKEG